MPNIQISDLPSAALPLPTLTAFFEVQTVEGGEDVSRKIAAGDIAVDLPDGTVLGSILVLDTAPDTYANSDQVVADGTNVILRDSLHASPNQPSLQTAIQGPFFAGRRAIADTSNTAVDGRITMTDLTNGIQTWDMGHQQTTALGVLLIRNHIEVSAISLRASSSGGTFGDRTLFEGLPDGNSQIFHGASNAPVARTTTVGAGGLEVDNQATGPGFERVLTLVDLFGGALNDLSDVTLTAPSTGSVLYKSAGDWLDTNAVEIDPTAAVQLRNNGVVRILTTANGATINASGALGLVTLFATASVASFYTQYNGTNGGVAIKNQNPGARLVQISTGGGEEDVWIEMTRNGAVALNHNNNLRLRTDINEGIAVIGDDDLRPKVVFRNIADDTDLGIVGFPNSTGITLRNNQIGGLISLTFTDVGPSTHSAFQATPGADARLYFDNVNVARTAAAASGGLEANNTLTGAGFERVLTTADLSGGAFGNLLLQANEIISTDTDGNVEINPDGVGEPQIKFNSLVRIRVDANAVRLNSAFTGADAVVTNEAPAVFDARFTQTADTGGIAVDVIHTSGLMRLLQTTNAGVPEKNLANFVRDGRFELFNNNVMTLRGLTAALGGAEVENSLTGVGFRRVLTEGDQLTDEITGDIAVPGVAFVTVMSIRGEINRTYSLTGFLMTLALSAADDETWRIRGPAGMTAIMQIVGIFTGASSFRVDETEATLMDSPGGGVISSGFISGSVIMGGTAGSVTIEVAKQADAGGDLTANESSWLQMVPVPAAP